ncbi:hypothetical protein ncot_12585 [Nocardioides sp. JQ2195]|uniref:septum formation family protein n=1 Tax=Nocardioides sp. JQ2195 TaxID=2592334 RepID=UPI00143E8DF3|nr:septum formation family protein [Nocardioides sp. JQ2195]QIX27344.1 hypothetical protein ncot_12585 [Nocardioides sp. JQ2195]
MIRVVAAVVLALGLLTGCSGADEPAADQTPTATPTSTPEPTPAEPAPRPDVGACYDLAYDEAIAPTSDRKAVPCKTEHTAQTVHVGQLDTVVDGHLVAVDSERVQRQVASSCPEQMAAFVGGTAEDLELSMLSAVWFSPTVEESDGGQNWYRCEVVALAGRQQLSPLKASMKGILATQEGRDSFGMCGTDRPGTQGFERVPCARDSSWRAISTVDVPAGRNGTWPGAEAAKAADGDTCKDAVRDEADDPLKFTWSYEWPTKKQWQAGQHHGFCWAPTS